MDMRNGQATDAEAFVKDAFSRNRGLISDADQQKLMATRVAVAGAGGVGGLHLLTLARMGVGKFTLADPDIFEAVNINRQFGAMQSTMGRAKADVLAEMIRDINPIAEITLYREAIGPENVERFFDGVDIYIDGIDFFEIAARRLVFQMARRRGVHAITAAPLGFGATLQLFSPTGMSFDDYCGITERMSTTEQIAAFAVALAPHPYHARYLDFAHVDLSRGKGPAVSPACTLAASFVATAVMQIVTGKGGLKPVPHYLQVDLLLGKHKRGYLFLGGKNPLQILKRRIVLAKVMSGR